MSIPFLLRLPVAIPVSASLVACSVFAMNVPTTSGGWVTGVSAGVALFLANISTGAAINARRRR
ncbi:hypothetical protein DEJ33_13905 [Curtobacterium sp. MCPF17_047]|uniref:hypothetical protein n=1 Tax=unclassified Curtobacterium TaxID=257496 RepID=UPI000DAA7FF8|nr:MULTISPECIES: hypothetical protein [unclassified Curtobacterium]PZF63469.1 hypothetical protein DEJ33_13905 [Curtobacterium sp. MCPF17_047]WIB13521.1 hypothetical protein DEJ36_07110 [Curtobacterium sp. MCPF17_052]